MDTTISISDLEGGSKKSIARHVVLCSAMVFLLLTGSCGDGEFSGDTWTDPSSGLTWQVAAADNPVMWNEANSLCAELDLDGGGWHLPTIGELRTLVRGCPGTMTGGVCGVNDDCLSMECWSEEGCHACMDTATLSKDCLWPKEMDGTCSWYWSSSLSAPFSGSPWFIDFGVGDGYVSTRSVYDGLFVRCVR